jgi:OOP family OmpA-OmpF porin
MRRTVWCAVAAAAVFSSGARAEALPQGMYLRLDTGYSWSTNAGLKDVNPGRTCLTCDSATLNNIGSSPFIGGGIGYRFNPMFRADLTAMHRGWYKLDSKDATGGTLRGDLRSTALMLNGYFDVPLKLGMVKPYVGAGVGWAHNSMDKIDYRYSGNFDGNTSETDPASSSNGFAWQVMAGAGIEISENVTIDVGYRYFDGGKLIGGKGVATYSNTAPADIEGIKGGLQAHEVIVGLRFKF